MKYCNYQSFEEEKLQCKACSVWKHYKAVVPSDGCKDKPKVMVLGEAPGADEIKVGKPFVGKAGKLLRQTLNHYEFRKGNTIISNVIPCRPLDNKFPQDKKLIDACVEMWLRQEIEILRPKYMILLGNQPLKYLLGEVGITKMRGTYMDFEGIPCMPTFHPSFVIRKLHMSDGEMIKDQFCGDIEDVAVRAGFVNGG